MPPRQQILDSFKRVENISQINKKPAVTLKEIHIKEILTHQRSQQRRKKSSKLCEKCQNL